MIRVSVTSGVLDLRASASGSYTVVAREASKLNKQTSSPVAWIIIIFFCAVQLRLRGEKKKKFLSPHVNR